MKFVFELEPSCSSIHHRHSPTISLHKAQVKTTYKILREDLCVTKEWIVSWNFWTCVVDSSLRMPGLVFNEDLRSHGGGGGGGFFPPRGRIL